MSSLYKICFSHTKTLHLTHSRSIRMSYTARFLVRTLFFELCAPVAFLLPQPWRLPLVGGGMVLLHLAIGALQSGAIGAFFLPCLGANHFTIGFRSSLRYSRYSRFIGQDGLDAIFFIGCVLLD